MTGLWLVSYIGLWLVTGFLLLTVFALARQIGLLHKRIAPFGARMTNAGVKIGERAPEVKAVDMAGQPLVLGSNRTKQTLVVFISASCASCAEMAPALRSIWKSERSQLDLVLVSLEESATLNQEFIAEHKLSGIPYIASRDTALAYGVMNAPYGILFDQQGVVRAKGVVNHMEHLESLLNAAQMQHPSAESLHMAQNSERKLPEAVIPIQG